MKMKAAVLYEHNTPLKVEEIDIADPKAGEVRVKIEASGFCHSDLHHITGDMATPLPMVLGHEGAGIVDAVGEGVTTVKPGDHVLMCVVVSCGKCPQCISGHPYRCERSMESMALLMGTQFDGTSRLSKNGKTIYHCFSQSSFAEYAIVSETAVAKVRNDAPLDKICGLGCAMGVGLGVVLNHPRLRVEPGESVAVFGCGGVGLSVIMAANLVSAKHIVAVDVLDSKLAVAKEVGATLTINATKENPVERIILDIGPVDYAFECVGKAELVDQAYNAIKYSGAVVVVGAMPMGVNVSFEGFTFVTGKSVLGVGGGFLRPAFDLPRFVDFYMDGKLPLDKIVSHHFKLKDVNKAVESLKKGESVKGVIIP